MERRKDMKKGRGRKGEREWDKEGAKDRQTGRQRERERE